MPKLYLVATPIGNLEDITLRALSVLKKADVVLSEKPLTTRKLFQKYQIATPLRKFHEHSKTADFDLAVKNLQQGKNLALVSEAGTPGISDPGGKLISHVIEKLEGQIEIIPIPGPSALVALASVAGFNTNRFLFLGFLPKKKKRNKFLKVIKDSLFPVIVYESVYRIEKFLQELEELKIKDIVVGRELTKKFETIYRGSPQEALSNLRKDKIKGEFVVLINQNNKRG